VLRDIDELDKRRRHGLLEVVWKTHLLSIQYFRA
jgi:hypothetical protein